jgi:hypothetical protein
MPSLGIARPSSWRRYGGVSMQVIWVTVQRGAGRELRRVKRYALQVLASHRTPQFYALLMGVQHCQRASLLIAREGSRHWYTSN